MSSDAAARKRELELKKQRLKEIQEKKNAIAAAAASSSIAGSPQPKPAERLSDILDTVSNLIGPSSTPPQTTPVTSPSLSSQQHGAPPDTASAAPATPPLQSGTRRKVVLSVQHNPPIDIAPKERVTYDKGTQFPDPLTASFADEDIPKSPAPQKHRSKYNMHKKEEEETVDNENTASTSTETGAAEGAADAATATIPELPQLDEEEKTRIIESEPFRDFIEKSSRIIDRALYLGEALDVMEDYRTAEEQAKQTNVHEATLKSTLFDERWSKHRSVTDLGWSYKHPELVLSSYSANEGGSHDPDGVVLVWNANNFFQKPEFVFNCQSSVMTAAFSKFHNTLVVGGTYSGQVVLWDTRARAMPVQRTPLSAVGHTHPIYSMAVVGSANAHNLVTISTDGKLCVWSMDNLSAPTETLELAHKSQKLATAAAPIAVTSLCFQEGEVNQFYVGSEEGALFQAYRHGATSGITERYEGHFGPVTSTDFHPARGSIDFSHLLLSASTDWTVKLWSSKLGTKPLYSFEDASDYVYDARWSPIHPAVFSTVDGTGYIDIWNMNEDTEAPLIKTKASQHSLNRVAWAADGRGVVAGDAAGYIYLYDVGDVGIPDNNEWNRFEEVLGQLGTNANKASSLQQTQLDDEGMPISVDAYPSYLSTVDSTA